MLALLRLAPEQVQAALLLSDFERGHPGVTILQPHYREELWRVEISEGTVPGDGRAMTGHGDGPADLLAQLEELFGTG